MTVGIRCARSFIYVLGVQTAFYRKGKGKTLVLIHGASPGACSDLNWFSSFDFLASHGYEVIAFDQAGFGYSETPADLSLEFRVRHAEAFLAALGVTSAVLVGNSMGGLISVLLDHRLKRNAIIIEGMVLLAPFPHFEMDADTRASAEAHRKKLGAVRPEFDSVKQLTQKTFFNPALASDDIVNLRTSVLLKNWSSDQARKKANQGLNVDLGSVRNKPISTPTLIVWGKNDASLRWEIALQALDHFPEAQLLLLPRCGHWPQTEQPAFVHSAMRAFVEALGARPPYKGHKGNSAPQR